MTARQASIGNVPKDRIDRGRNNRVGTQAAAIHVLMQDKWQDGQIGMLPVKAVSHHLCPWMSVVFKQHGNTLTGTQVIPRQENVELVNAYQHSRHTFGN